MREPTTIYTFAASMDLRDELHDLQAFISERDGFPASQSAVIRAALRIGLDALKRKRDAASKKRPSLKKPDPYAGPLPPGFVPRVARAR